MFCSFFSFSHIMKDWVLNLSLQDFVCERENVYIAAGGEGGVAGEPKIKGERDGERRRISER